MIGRDGTSNWVLLSGFHSKKGFVRGGHLGFIMGVQRVRLLRLSLLWGEVRLG